MKTQLSIRLLFIFLFCCTTTISCIQEQTDNITHKGECSWNASAIIDTLSVKVPGSSGTGNFYMKDSIITYVDAMACTFFDISLNGELLSQYFQKGKGPNELLSVMFAYDIKNDIHNRCFIIDNSNRVSLFNTKNKNINHVGSIDFGWSNHRHNDYKSPSLYNIIEFTDLGVSFYSISDSIVLFPLSIINRVTKSPDIITKKRYKNGAILGELNLKTMKVEEVKGKYPEIYRQKPMPHLEFFDYALVSDTLYVNHAVDSLIYVYKYPDNLLYCIGYECIGINRDYTTKSTIDFSVTFKEDLRRVGLNSGVVYCKENNTLCRTYFKSAATGKCGLQIYRDNNLIADVNVPDFFKLLGYRDGYYYGIRYTTTGINETLLSLYKIKININ